MSQVFNIYCDESCHLEGDREKVMILGALWCATENACAIARQIRDIKSAYSLPPGFEIKWTKVSPAKVDFYLALVDYFFANSRLHFRAVIADKVRLNHRAFAGQKHDDWYYKMLFYLLSPLLNPKARYRIFLDLKDTQSGAKAIRLRDVLCNSHLDFDRQLIDMVQPVRSHEVEQIQLCDLLLGAVGYANRRLSSNSAKIALVNRIKQHSTYSLLLSTLLGEKKFNLFHWQGQEVIA